MFHSVPQPKQPSARNRAGCLVAVALMACIVWLGGSAGPAEAAAVSELLQPADLSDQQAALQPILIAKKGKKKAQTARQKETQKEKQRQCRRQEARQQQPEIRPRTRISRTRQTTERPEQYPEHAQEPGHTGQTEHVRQYDSTEQAEQPQADKYRVHRRAGQRRPLPMPRRRKTTPDQAVRLFLRAGRCNRQPACRRTAPVATSPAVAADPAGHTGCSRHCPHSPRTRC